MTGSLREPALLSVGLSRLATHSAEMAAVVCSALARLPVAQAELLEAFHFEVSQIAERSGLLSAR